ncbi:hypothetical protein DOTSEDRAFT_68487 [Lecanosticta acicola]|uniref:F-box domain-containing protein n=1 Tax=Lecanosticta acicola TaxID=111012 RepID=A0AAI8YZT8_9PEZI|nr:hypothetical protein DOTSEDRAFT_68487 [Lecanosticta acicola]
MSHSLERVLGVRQTSKAATSLPLELQQQIFSYLDTRSFYAARKVCQYWHFASTDAVPLAKQLQRLPILPRVDAATSTPSQLYDLFDEAARTLMVGVKTERTHDKPGLLTKASKLGFPINPRVTATTNGNKTVTLNGRVIGLFDTSGDTPVCLAQRPLNDLKETVGSGPWLNIQPNSYNELALSSDGSLLAIAQERTIQIYNLLDEPDSFTISEYVSSASGHYICGLDFEQDDYVLRVRLSGKGAVVYLGTPQGVEEAGTKATMQHWKSRAGLKHTFVDSSLLAVSSSSRNPDDHAPRISGLQLLRPFENGYLFAGQKHGGGESSHYILGHVKCSISGTSQTLTAEPANVAILERLESFLSSWDFTLDSSSEGGIGLWENMPSAHEHHPRFTMTLDKCFLALAERDKKRIRPAPLTQLFVYRLPTEQELRATLAQTQADRKGTWTTLAGFLDKLETERPQAEHQPVVPPPRLQYTVPRVPLCLSTIQGDITDMTFHSVDESTCSISASTDETTRTWLLQEM